MIGKENVLINHNVIERIRFMYSMAKSLLKYRFNDTFFKMVNKTTKCL